MLPRQQRFAISSVLLRLLSVANMTSSKRDADSLATLHAIQTLTHAFSEDQIALAGTETFNKLDSSHLSLLQSEIRPAAIVLPRDKHDVAMFVRLVAPYALDVETKSATRGAGQQPVPGCSNIESPGITLDLRDLTGIDIQDNVVSIGAGERWGAVYEKLTEQGLGVTGSRSALGGIGGLALAGDSAKTNNGYGCM